MFIDVHSEGTSRLSSNYRHVLPEDSRAATHHHHKRVRCLLEPCRRHSQRRSLQNGMEFVVVVGVGGGMKAEFRPCSASLDAEMFATQATKRIAANALLQRRSLTCTWLIDWLIDWCWLWLLQTGEWESLWCCCGENDSLKFWSHQEQPPQQQKKEERRLKFHRAGRSSAVLFAIFLVIACEKKNIASSWLVVWC